VLQLNGSWLHVSASLRPSSGQLFYRLSSLNVHTTYHWGHLICTIWPEVGCNADEKCSQEPLSCST